MVAARNKLLFSDTEPDTNPLFGISSRTLTCMCDTTAPLHFLEQLKWLLYKCCEVSAHSRGHHRVDFCDQVLVRHGLDQVLNRALPHTPDLVGLLILGRDHDHGD